MENLLQHHPIIEYESMEHPGPHHKLKTDSANSKTLQRTSKEYKNGDSDSDLAHPQQQTRNRQKKFIKNFKQLPSKEIVLERKLNSNHQLFTTKDNEFPERPESNMNVHYCFFQVILVHWLVTSFYKAISM